MERTVRPSTPPQVLYALTQLGRSLADPVHQLAEWAMAHLDDIHDSQAQFDDRSARTG